MSGICKGCSKLRDVKPNLSCPLYEGHLEDSIKHSEYCHKWHMKNRVYRLAYLKTHYDKKAVYTMKKYGDRCACVPCGFNDFNKKVHGDRFLQIDHINGGGHQQFLKLREQGTTLLNWIIKNNYPPGFRILCAACNPCMEPKETVCEYHKWLGDKS